jgi:hypothetical protein
MIKIEGLMLSAGEILSSTEKNELGTEYKLRKRTIHKAKGT